MQRRAGNFPVRGRVRKSAPGRGVRTLNLIDDVFREMNDMVSRAQQLWGDDDNRWEHSLTDFAHSPAVDFEEDDEAYLLSFELPGLKVEDVNVDITDGVLRISGEKRTKREDKGDGRSVRERSYGRFSRSLRLPDNIDDAKIEARFEDGVLELTLPKREDETTQTRKIDIAGPSQIEADGDQETDRAKASEKTDET